MHKSLNADNTPIGWIKVCLGLDLMFQKMPIIVLSARLNVGKARKQRGEDVLPMRSSWVQQCPDRRYGAQMDLVGVLYLFQIVISRAFYRLQLFLQQKFLATMDISFLLKKLDCLRQLAFLRSDLGQGILYLLDFRQQGFSFCR